jgi:hypothetical protein
MVQLNAGQGNQGEPIAMNTMPVINNKKICAGESMAALALGGLPQAHQPLMLGPAHNALALQDGQEGKGHGPNKLQKSSKRAHGRCSVPRLACLVQPHRASSGLRRLRMSTRPMSQKVRPSMTIIAVRLENQPQLGYVRQPCRPFNPESTWSIVRSRRSHGPTPMTPTDGLQLAQAPPNRAQGAIVPRNGQGEGPIL